MEVAPDQQCVIILGMLPVDTPPSLVLSLQDITNVIERNEKIEKPVHFFEEHKGSHGLRVQMVENKHAHGLEPSVQDEPDEIMLALSGLDADTQIEILRAAKTGGFRGKIKTNNRGPAPGQRSNGRPSTPPRAQAPGIVRPNCCGNFGDCSQPLLDPQPACLPQLRWHWTPVYGLPREEEGAGKTASL